MVVDEVMTRNPVTISKKASIREAIDTLIELDVRHLPVVHNGELVGIVSDRDLRAFWSLDALASPQWADKLNKPIGTLMTSDVISVNPETELSEVADLMIDHRVGALPVVEPNGAKLVGIVSYIDVLRAAAEHF